MSIRHREPSFNGEVVVERVFVDGPDSISWNDLYRLLLDMGAMPASQVIVHGASLSWERPPTEEEKQQTADYNRRRAEHLEKWERETLARLKEKYGD